MGGFPRGCCPRGPGRLPGEAALGIAFGPGRYPASLGEQLRVARAHARLFLPEELPRLRARPSMPPRGSILFRQIRPGHSGKPIVVYKFRTMRPGLMEDKRQAAVTEVDDDRITRVGRVLRRMRLDELPQIINILRLEMSWIGPRPEAL